MKKNLQDALSRAIMAALSRWSADTSHLSASHQIRKHPGLSIITVIGDQAIPTLIRQIRQHPWLCMMCLGEIVGAENGPTIPDDERGKIEPQIAAWTRWYRKRVGISE